MTNTPPINQPERTLILRYDEYEIWSEKPTYYDKHPEVYGDDIQFYWNDITENFTEAMQKVGKDTSYWRVNVTNHGWTHQSGYKYVNIQESSDNAAVQMIRETLPRGGEFTFDLYEGKTTWEEKEREVLIMIANHHDAHGEEYTLIPVDAEEWDKNN